MLTLLLRSVAASVLLASLSSLSACAAAPGERTGTGSQADTVQTGASIQCWLPYAQARQASKDGAVVGSASTGVASNAQFMLPIYLDASGPSACEGPGAVAAGALQSDPTIADLVERSVFDPDDYLTANPDVTAAKVDPFVHWLTFGIDEGRSGSAPFWSAFYLSSYPDLRAAFQNDYRAAIHHWVKYGLVEGRQGAVRPEVFDATYYLSSNPDLVAGGIVTPAAAIQHWAQHGVAEGRRASAQFWSVAYLNRYPDVAAAFGPTNYGAAATHYLEYGIAEQRSGF
jgi:hypothetical protein